MVLGALHKPSKIPFPIEIGGFNSSEKELQVKKKNNQPTALKELQSQVTATFRLMIICSKNKEKQF